MSQYNNTNIPKKTSLPSFLAEQADRPISGTKNNLIFSLSEFSPQVTILNALDELAAEGYSLTSGNYISMEKNCEDLLNSLGFHPVNYEKLDGENSSSVKFSKDFSLAKTLNIDSTIENNRIVDPDLADLTPNPIATNDKFKSETDSFYDLDDEKPDNINRLEQEHKKKEAKKLFKISELLTHESRKSRNKMLKRTPKRNKMRV
jgi:hypothetical protein